MSTERRRCDAPAPVVWEVLSDPWLFASWVVGASRIRDVTGQWPADESLIHHSVGIWPLLLDDTTSVVSSTPGSELVLRARGRPLGEAHVELRLEDEPGGCAIVMTERAVKGLGKLLPHPVHDAAIGVRNREALRRLALIAEGRHSGPKPARGTEESSE
jgi:Polyketide cyclase / dehydrase and lipid transport